MKYYTLGIFMVSGFKYQSIHEEKELNIPDKSSGNSNWNAYRQQSYIQAYIKYKKYLTITFKYAGQE